METRAEMKRTAKNRLRRHWMQGILLNLVPVILLVLLALLIGNSFRTSTYSWTDFGRYYATVQAEHHDWARMFINIIETFFLVGVSFTSLDWIRNADADIAPVKDSFQAFQGQYLGSVIFIYILKAIYLFLWSLLLIIPGIIKFYAYRQTYLVMKDAKASGQQMNTNACITRSRQLMRGHKMDLFMLDLSFIGWDILAICTAGIGYLWLNPYKQLTYAAFYNDLLTA
ncbi:putative integral membrane protein [Lactobacillus selangorensis]|uniref:Putative integral membrane protein n=1 Tax=Lactobacillus selangorensis TaxID=81857 RepID=A0A0R2FR24_9LACO|nr:DUF975 family protein [Lactobacillus selangorensis]KRN28178.1 putative integral membrane protein [Lactobacillus selangorensis]KRN30946.1 putative integral membrane protein [Lactobacillus selangorensis]